MLEDDVLKRIQAVLGVDEENLSLVSELAKLQIDALVVELGGIPIPAPLSFIVVETTIARYRRVGAEGITDKKVDVISNSYSDDLFKPYQKYIDKYAVNEGGSKRIVRMI